MTKVNFESLSRMERIFYLDLWPDFLFINQYPVVGIFWNVFLLLIPFFIFLFLARYYSKTHFQKIQQKAFALFLFLLWVLFIPNAAYIMTDARHIIGYCEIYNFYRICLENAWMIIFFFSYALLGWIGFVILLRQMRDFVEKVFTKKIGLFFILSIIPMISLGVLLGLINRWNSWELFINPLGIFTSIKIYFTDFVYFKNFLIFTLNFYILYFVGEKLFKKFNFSFKS